MKNKLIIPLVIGVIVVAGLLYYALGRDKGSEVNSDQASADQMSEKGQSNPLFSSIKDAMSRGLVLECTYKDENGQNITAIIQGQKIRMTLANQTDKTAPNNFLVLDQTMYMWSDTNKQGFMVAYDDSTMKKAQEQVKGAEDVEKATNADVIGALEQYKSSCKETTAKDSLFVKPADVTFTDFSKLYQQR
jgi:hypothetical protein